MRVTLGGWWGAGHVEVRCEFCAEVVRFEEGELDSILETQEA